MLDRTQILRAKQRLKNMASENKNAMGRSARNVSLMAGKIHELQVGRSNWLLRRNGKSPTVGAKSSKRNPY